MLGDNGVVTYVALSAGTAGGWGNAQKYETTDTLDVVTTPAGGTGGADSITITGDGNNTILGGMGADTISTKNNTGSGTDVILGDSGVVELDAKGIKYAQVKTYSQTSAGG
ncbi:MAG: hypothetical protein EBR23_13740, partial [Planctomycetia bacterium]|nr:hypothetical protein [Planctomycetia bacterium]